MGWLYTKRSVTLETNSAGGVTDWDVGKTMDGRVNQFAGYTGELVSIQYVKDDYDAGVDFAITADVSGQQLWVEDNVDASTIDFPLILAQSVLGVDLTAVYVRPVLVEDRVKIVITNGGDTKSGTFIITTRQQV